MAISLSTFASAGTTATSVSVSVTVDSTLQLVVGVGWGVYTVVSTMSLNSTNMTILSTMQGTSNVQGMIVSWGTVATTGAKTVKFDASSISVIGVAGFVYSGVDLTDPIGSTVGSTVRSSNWISSFVSSVGDLAIGIASGFGYLSTNNATTAAGTTAVDKIRSSGSLMAYGHVAGASTVSVGFTVGTTQRANCKFGFTLNAALVYPTMSAVLMG